MYWEEVKANLEGQTVTIENVQIDQITMRLTDGRVLYLSAYQIDSDDSWDPEIGFSAEWNT